MANQIPPFLSLEGDALIFNQENKEFVFYVPEVFFEGTSKNPVAEISGKYVSMIGLCEWTIIDSAGKKGPIRPFRFPTMFLCAPYKIEKVKGLILRNEVGELSDDENDDNSNPALEVQDPSLSKDYRILHFRKGDEVVSQVRVPQLIDNVELFYKIMLITAKVPVSIPYHKIWELFIENMALNGDSYNLSAQLFGIITGGICRDKANIARPFRMTNMKDMHSYKPLSVKLLPKYVSPYTAVVSENFDESIRSAIMMKDMKEEDIPYSPLEKIVTQ